MKYDPKLDFEQTIEKTLLDLRRRFYVREVRYDPYQLVAVAQRLTQQGLPMTEFAQSVPNLTEASTNLYGEPWLWGLLELAPAPAAGSRLQPKTIERLLRQHHIRRLNAPDVEYRLQ